MSKEKKNTQNEKRKLTRQEKKQIDALIRQAKGDGKPHTAQDSIPFERMYKDGICRLANGRYSKCIEFEDINYQLAQPDDKTAIFEALCDMYNSFDASISVQLSLISRHANKEDFKSSITIAPQNDDFDSIRAEYTEMLQTQLERGNNGLIKTKFLTFTIEAKDIKSARARLARIETDTLNHFKVIGAAARVLDGKQRLEVLHGLFHPDGERFNFAWEWLPVSGLSVKDFIAPSSFRFGDGRMFQMGGKFGAVSFLQIAAPELSDRMLADFMEAENGIVVNLHIQSIDHNEAIKTTVLLAALVIMCGLSVTAYAGGGSESDLPPTPVTEETPPPETEPEETTGGYEPQPLTPDGNMSLVDDITGEASGDKQFITVVTKSGNYFYIIIDRAEDGENTVHFLNQVDEADLTALMEDGQTEAPVCSCTEKCVAGSVNTDCPVCSVNMSECAGKEAEPEPEETEQPPEEEKGGGMGILLVVLLVAAAGGGAFYYFKILKPKKDAAKGSSSLDDLDFDEDDEETEVVETEQTEQEDDNL